MAYTSHGHQIPGTDVEIPEPTTRARCGGPGFCNTCSVETAQSVIREESDSSKDCEQATIPDEEWEIGTPDDYPSKAKRIVRNWIDERHLRSKWAEAKFPEYDVYVVWFCKTLQNWKAIVSTTIDDGMIYEVTYDGDKRRAYLDSYRKQSNSVIPD